MFIENLYIIIINEIRRVLLKLKSNKISIKLYDSELITQNWNAVLDTNIKNGKIISICIANLNLFLVIFQVKQI